MPGWVKQTWKGSSCCHRAVRWEGFRQQQERAGCWGTQAGCGMLSHHSWRHVRAWLSSFTTRLPGYSLSVPLRGANTHTSPDLLRRTCFYSILTISLSSFLAQAAKTTQQIRFWCLVGEQVSPAGRLTESSPLPGVRLHHMLVSGKGQWMGDEINLSC